MICFFFIFIAKISISKFYILGVWSALTPLYNSIEELKEKTWLSVQPRKLRQSLDELLAQLKQLPAKYRSYDSYEYMKRLMHNYSKVNIFYQIFAGSYRVKII